MRRLLVLIFAAAALGGSALLSGCASGDPSLSQIPHSRPAGFENQGPAGIGGSGRGF
ncbi:MAG: hypothetical protein ACFB20_01330 [Opitutales bacterium]